MDMYSMAQVPLDKPLYGASPGEAVSRFFRKYGTFTGRASRSEFWWVEGFQVLLLAVVILILARWGTYVPDYAPDSMFRGMPVSNDFGNLIIVCYGIWALAVLVPNLALTVRRLHDANFSGLFVLFSCIPGGAMVILILMLIGPNPAGERYDLVQPLQTYQSQPPQQQPWQY